MAPSRFSSERPIITLTTKFGCWICSSFWGDSRCDERIEAGHAAPADLGVDDGVLEHVAHVERTGDVGRRYGERKIGKVCDSTRRWANAARTAAVRKLYRFPWVGWFILPILIYYRVDEDRKVVEKELLRHIATLKSLRSDPPGVPGESLMVAPQRVCAID